MPTNEDDIIDWIDDHITARLPNPATDPEYHEKVTNYNIHHHSRNQVNACIMKDGRCKRGYDAIPILPRSMLNDLGFPNYKRLFDHDLNIVPHNKAMMMLISMWNIVDQLMQCCICTNICSKVLIR
jgi:hypothetical protein